MPYLLSCPLSWNEEDSENLGTLHEDSMVFKWEEKSTPYWEYRPWV